MADSIAVTGLGNGRYRVSDGSQHQLAWAVGPASSRWVYFDGRVHLINASSSGDVASSSMIHDEMAMASPMPATVSAVNIAPGQTVGRGDVLVMLEAMKMELAIRAPRDGRVRSVACAAGELVQPGVPLVELE